MSAAAGQPGQELTRAAAQAREATEPPRALAAVPQYATGFEGAAMAPFAPEAAAVLAAPVNEGEVEVRSDGIVYLPGVAYRRILTRAFGAGAWALLPRGPSRTMGELVVYHGALYILGRFVSEAMGECETRQGMSYASSLEGARTDCLTRCCKDLGIATELWDPAWRDGWLKKYTEREWVPPEGNRKGKWKYWLKDKAGTASLVSGRNVGVMGAGSLRAGTPDDVRTCEFCGSTLPFGTSKFRGCCSQGAKADADAAVAATVAANAKPAAPHDAAPDDVPAVGPDTGEAPSDEQIAELQRLAKAAKWANAKARNWLSKHFGVQSSTALTKRQAEDARDLLVAAAKDDMDAEYGALMERLAAEGRVRL